MDEKKMKTVDELRGIITDLERRILDHQRLEQALRNRILEDKALQETLMAERDLEERNKIDHIQTIQRLEQELANERTKKDNYRWTNEELLGWGLEWKIKAQRLMAPVSNEELNQHIDPEIGLVEADFDRIIAARANPKQEEPGEERLCG